MSHFVKLFGSILQSTVWGLDSDARVVWITMLALADRDGLVLGTVPGLARTAVVPQEAVRSALDSFLGPDPDSSTKTDEGRRIREVTGGWLIINYADYRERASAAERREKDAVRKRRSRGVVPGSPLMSEPVRDCPDQSHHVTPASSVGVGSESETGSGSDAREADPGRETQCPLDLHMIADTNGTLVSLAEKLSVPLDSIRHESRQFVAYWTIGKGAGQRRTGWMGRLRQRIVEQHGKNQLTAVGAVEHEKPKRAPRQLRSLASATLRKPPERPSMISPIDAEELQRRVDAAMRGET